jgi:uncharacterized protein YcbK (DUF882 family)
MAESKSFKVGELTCSCCGKSGVQQWALDKLQTIRDEYNKPIRITSSYRCGNHPVERTKAKPGTHNQGIAFDVAVANGAQRYELVSLAIKHGANGIGVDKNFVHIDFRDTAKVAWVY